jgi:hypothetical protein
VYLRGLSMAFEKHYTAKQAAEAVLKKVHDLLQKSELNKKYMGFKAVEESARESGASDPAAVAAAAGRKKYGKKAFQEAAAAGKKMGKAEESKHDRCVEHVKENSPEVKNPHAVCVAEGVRPAKWSKSEMEKGETENSKKLGYKPSKLGAEEKEPEKSDKAFEVKGKDSKSSDDPRLAEQKSPEANPKEKAEGNNELAGTTPNQVGKDGKNIAGFDEMRGHLKLAKFIGHMEAKRKMKKGY